jgi:DNA-binding Lrp family transcriptional regulator
MLDEIDIGILNILQKNCRIRVGEIAMKLGLPKSTIGYRIKRMEENEIIQGYYAKINAAKLGKDYTTIIRVRAKFGPRFHEKVGKKLSQIPGVWGVYFILGGSDFVILCNSDDREDFMQKLEQIYDMAEIERTNTAVVIKTIKEDPMIQLRLGNSLT